MLRALMCELVGDLGMNSRDAGPYLAYLGAKFA